MNVLAVFAHPDDEVLAAGGCLAAYARAGHAVHIAILGEGLTSRSPDREQFVRDAGGQFSELQACAREAGRLLGAAAVRFASLPDNRFDAVDRLDVIKIIEALKTEILPDLVLTHHAGDMNVDHRVVADAVMTAFRSLPGEKPCGILAGEVLSSTDYTVGLPGCSFEPNVWIPLKAEDVDRKERALMAYKGEVRRKPHPRSTEVVRALATLRGAQCGTLYAEAFRLLRTWGWLFGIS